MATGVRSVVMTGNPKDVPHVMTVCHPKTNQAYEFLLTIRGRKPLCLRCRHEGHYRRDCFTPFCRHHGEYGHTTESCSVVVDSAPSAVEPSSGGVLSDSDDASSEGGDIPQWQLVAGRHKRKREEPLAPEPLVTRPLPPGEPKLGRLVIADDDPDPKILRQNSSGSESESSV